MGCSSLSSYRSGYNSPKLGAALARICVLALACCVCLASTAESDRETVYLQARQLLQQGQASEAFALLSEHELQWSGEDAFDYLLGVAALDGGEAGEAIFSLQRLVTRRPAFSGARMDLARAYYDIGDNELARVEFDRILAENPPARVRNAAIEYKRAIDNKARQYSSVVQSYFDFGMGYDSNAPAATDDDIFLSFTLNDNNLEQSSGFAQAVVGTTWNRPLTPSSQLLINARLDHRGNPSAHFVDLSNLDLGLGWSWKQADQSVSVVANSVFSALDREYNKRDIALTVNYSRKINKAWTAAAFLRSGSLRFEEAALEVQDVDQVMIGASISQAFSSALLNVTIMGTNDDSKQRGSPFSADGYGIRISNNWFRPGGRVYFLEAGFNATEYDDLFFGLDREDDVISVSGGMSLARFPLPDWTTSIRLNYSEKDSTVSLYEFDRFEVGFSLRKIF